MTHALVLTALDVEARGLARHLGLTPVGTGEWAHYHGGVLEVAAVGMRAVFLEARAAQCATPSLVISAGACGALAPALAVGSLVVPEAVMVEDGSRLPADAVEPLSRVGTLLTVSRVVETPAAKARLWVETGAVAVDMESAPILDWARRLGARAAVVRAVSDIASAEVPAALAGLVEPGGRLRTSQALRLALTSPRQIAAAVSLGRGTSAALATVAAALGKVARA